LQAPESLLQSTILKRWQQSLTSDEVIQIATVEDVKGKKITTQNAVNHWHFVAKNISDVVFGISDHYVWSGASVVVDDLTGRRAGVQAVFNDTTKEYHPMTSYVRHSLDWFSHHWPGVPFPYEKLIYFQTSEEMEYPMLVKGSTCGDDSFARFVTEHEIVHTYFPFYMGINETRYGFMDEGWATTFELLIGREDMGAEQAEKFYKQFRVVGWTNDPSAGQDMAIINPTENVVGAALGNNEYGKPSLAYLALKDLLGDAEFKKCLLAFMTRWHGKHPIPWDMFFTFNNVSGKNLNWFWNNWFFSNHYIDVAIESVKASGKEHHVSIKNIGGMAIPFDVIVTFTDGTKKIYHQTPAAWKPDEFKSTIKIPSSKPIVSISLDGGIFMDADRTNNSMTRDNMGSFGLSPNE
jgi:hypothetical protein